MTVIAWDGRYIAADGLTVADGVILGLNEKKIELHDGRIYATSGSNSNGAAAIKWHRAGADAEKAPKALGPGDGWGLAVITSSGCMSYTDTTPHGEPMAAPQAWGAGWKMAMGAMFCGVSAENAARMCAVHHTECGGEIQVINIAEALTPKLKEAAE